MSEIMQGVLRMPPELFWAESPITRAQHDYIRLEAADEIDRLRAEVERLSAVQGEPADHYDQAPDWSKAPEGATHWGPGEDGGAYAAWYRKKDGEWECWLYPSDHYWGYSNPLGRILIPRPEPEWIPSNGQEPELPDDTLYARTSDAAPQPAEQQPAPAVQGEPVGWYTEVHLDDKSATTYNAEVAQRWRAKGWPVTPLYTTPQLARELPPFCIVCEFSSTSPDVLFVEAEIEGESVSLVWRDRADGLKELIVPRHTATQPDVQGEPVDELCFEYRHPKNGETHIVRLSREEVAERMDQELFEKLTEAFCECAPIGETNVVDCRCDEYADEFELYAAPQPALSRFLEKEEWDDAFAQGFNAGFNSDEKPAPDVAGLVEALEEGLRAIGDHHAPDDCYATGPMTGDPFRDLVQCPACSFIAMCDAALATYRNQGGAL